jgi:valyl-tRNA synthetase
MPFITEEIYQHLDRAFESITISEWPGFQEELHDAEAEEDMAYIIEAIKSIRNVRAEMNVPPSRKAKLFAYASKEAAKAFQNGTVYFEKLASAASVEFLASKDSVPENTVSLVTAGGEMFIPLLDLVDREKELERLNKEKTKLLAEIDRVEKKLTNEKFISKAPQAVVDEEKAKGDKYKEMLEAVLQRIESLN